MAGGTTSKQSELSELARCLRQEKLYVSNIMTVTVPWVLLLLLQLLLTLLLPGELREEATSAAERVPGLRRQKTGPVSMDHLPAEGQPGGEVARCPSRR